MNKYAGTGVNDEGEWIDAVNQLICWEDGMHFVKHLNDADEPVNEWGDNMKTAVETVDRTYQDKLSHGAPYKEY